MAVETATETGTWQDLRDWIRDHDGKWLNIGVGTPGCEFDPIRARGRLCFMTYREFDAKVITDETDLEWEREYKDTVADLKLLDGNGRETFSFPLSNHEVSDVQIRVRDEERRGIQGSSLAHPPGEGVLQAARDGRDLLHRRRRR